MVCAPAPVWWNDLIWAWRPLRPHRRLSLCQDHSLTQTLGQSTFKHCHTNCGGDVGSGDENDNDSQPDRSLNEEKHDRKAETSSGSKPNLNGLSTPLEVLRDKTWSRWRRLHQCWWWWWWRWWWWRWGWWWWWSTHLTHHESGGVKNAADADPEHKSVAEEDLLQPARKIILPGRSRHIKYRCKYKIKWWKICSWRRLAATCAEQYSLLASLVCGSKILLWPDPKANNTMEEIRQIHIQVDYTIVWMHLVKNDVKRQTLQTQIQDETHKNCACT